MKFDLCAFLLGEIYSHMDGKEKKSWDMHAANALCADLNMDGIEADVPEVFGIIAEFIAQDNAQNKMV